MDSVWSVTRSGSYIMGDASNLEDAETSGDAAAEPVA